ncbi:uncharacterized protein LOC115443436 [Manduca sexta]|uniref:uncharacterized protein LOC115443436 n=1 Tax=Manduca sexta TaxID=7130 RepID=UPI001184043F|nr:uncharacterized protein LOC115443436 [Manduca sexta]
MRILVAVACILLCAANLATAEQFVYKFGYDVGGVIHTGEGNIPLLKYTKEINIPVPADVRVTYVEVIIDALSSPQVQYDSLNHKVVITYSWTQITLSKYKIIVKGF